MNRLYILFILFATLTGISACSNARAADQDASKSAFKYREVYLPEGIGKSADKLGLNSVEEDWGIWGHNLAKVLPEEHTKAVYAKVNGNLTKKQFCFTSDELYDYIVDYVETKYDDDQRIRFAIVPNDNDIVCLCVDCIDIGNTKNNASPAVNHLVRRLANRFPGHIFYTSDYRTTRGLPKDSMPPNSGVLVSAMNFPLTAANTPDQKRFMDRLLQWSNTTPRILVWDYINNFDDYFTPFPTFGIMQNRLQGYRDNKVTAVFLNGSGPDISAMSRLRTEVLAALTANPDIDWREKLYERADSIYPTTGKVIADFMVAQEDAITQNGVTLPLYQGVEGALKTYLPKDMFIEFHDNLLSLRNNTSGQEKKELDLLLGQLALTRLELNRISGDLKNSEIYLADLGNLTAEGYESYNESGWGIDQYVKDYNYILRHAKETGGKNKLKGETLIPLSALDPDYSDISILTDGVLGIPSNYHSGNLINSPERATQIAIPNQQDFKKLRVWLSYNPAYRVNLPESVTLTVGGKPVKTVNPSYPADMSGHVPVEFDIPGNARGSLVVSLVKDPETHSMAIEEIEAF